MNTQSRKPAANWIRRGAVVCGVALVATGLGVRHLRAPATTPVMRGQVLAQQLGCLGCHSPFARAPFANPLSAEGVIPPLDAGGAYLFFVQSEEELREWILDGRPARLRERSERPTGHVEMPAYRDHVNAEELEDLVAFVRAVAEPALPSEPRVLEGRRIAEANGCFACHGMDGRAAVPNPGSFKGVIPAWNSEDYPKLVKDQGELREWIQDGVIERFERNPLAGYFLDRQAISMPAYGELLSASELDSLVAYVEWCTDPGDSSTSFRRRPTQAVGTADVIARGADLYRSTGCAACHGADGAGGVPNAMAPGGFVPSLDLLAERLQLFEEEEVEVVLDGLASGATFESMAEDPPLEYFDEVLEAYRDVRSVILEGRLTPGASSGDEPAMRMPAWSERTGGCSGPHSDADIDAIVAYLLTQY